MNATLNYLHEFDDEVKPSQSIAYLQVINPPNLSLEQVKQYQVPWGWFVPAEQAQEVNFEPNDWFVPTRLTFGEDTTNKREVDGWLSQRVRVAIIHRSAIEVQEKTSTGWKYAGVAYSNGHLTEVGQMTASDKDNYRLRTRYLILFLSEDNQPLHKVPLCLGLNRGTGGSLGEEIKTFRGEIERVFFKLQGQHQKSLSDRAHALTVLDLELGIHKGEGKNPFVCPARRYAPAINDVGVEKVVDRRDRSVTLVGKPIEELLIPKSSETGKVILSLWEEYKDFPTRYQDELIHKPDTTAPTPLDTLVNGSDPDWDEDF